VGPKEAWGILLLVLVLEEVDLMMAELTIGGAIVVSVELTGRGTWMRTVPGLPGAVAGTKLVITWLIVATVWVDVML